MRACARVCVPLQSFITPSQFMAESYFMKWLQLEYWRQTTASEDTGLAISCCSGPFSSPEVKAGPRAIFRVTARGKILVTLLIWLVSVYSLCHCAEARLAKR